jgi:hypothetical protein
MSVEATNAFIEYKQTKSNYTITILAETFLLLNHYRLYGRGAMRCCIPLLFIWVVGHLETLRKSFNNL